MLLKFTIPADQLGLVEQMVFLELYNHGTRPAKDIAISIGGNEIARIDYIKPNGAECLPIGVVWRTLAGNKIIIDDNELNGETAVCVEVSENGKTTTYSVNTSTLYISSFVLHNESEKLVDAMKDINKTVERAFDCRFVGPGHSSFRDELRIIAENTKQK